MTKRIMIVDDNINFLAGLRDLLSLTEYEVIAVRDPVEVISEATRKKPDIILLDLKMPKKNGLQIADEIRHTTELSNIPIIMMTGYLNGNQAIGSEICGIQQWVKKPFNPLDLIYQIEKLVM